MKNLLTVTIVTLFVCMQSLTATEINPNEIITKCLETYHKMKSFKANGESINKIDMDSRKIETKTTFTLLIEKPNLYKIVWSQNNGLTNNGGAVWNAGDGPFLYMGIIKTYSKMKNDKIALAGATGISSGVAYTIPSLLLLQNNIFKALEKNKYIKEEQINGEMCYVIDGKTPAFMVRVWISKSRFLFLKVKKDMGEKSIPKNIKITDKQIAKTLKAMGKEVTEESIKNMKNIMKMAASMTKKMKVTFIETYSNIEINKSYKKEKFLFTLPQNAILKNNLFDNTHSLKMPKIKNLIKKESLKEMERTLNSESKDIKKFYMLSKLAKQAFEENNVKKASKYANELLNKADNYKNDWNYGNAIHHGNLILGRIAIKSGKLEEAEIFLIKAGKTPGSPQLNSFGPNMTLAKELLKKGKTKTVLEYFNLCGKFWKMDRDRLKNWSLMVKEGKDIDFGANMLY